MGEALLVPGTTEINDCRVCLSPLETVGSLGNVPLSTFTETPVDSPKLPLEMKFCNDCSLPQLGHDYDRDGLYGDYWYRSSLNNAILADLAEIARHTSPGDTHIDIGSNDNSLLRFSRASRKIAVDPSNIGGDEFERQRDYWENVDLGVKADVITAVACLYDLPDPNAFVGNVQAHLAPRGRFVSQLMTLEPMVAKNDVGNIVHEHTEYYPYGSLVRLFEQNGLEIYDLEENGMNGGSYRLFARHLKEGSIEHPEKEYTPDDMHEFFERIEKQRDRFLEWAGDTAIVGYGASTKANTITSYYDYTPDKIVDVNPDKIGKFTPMGAQVVGKIPEGTENLWVFPYGFVDYFKAREIDYKGKWVTTIPGFEVL